METTTIPSPSAVPAAALLFAWEFAGASAGQNGEFRTQFGAFSNTIFCIGTLTEKTGPITAMTSLRVSDPTGVFTITLDQQNKTVMNAAETIDIPAFVAISGTVKLRKYATTTRLELIPDTLTLCDRRSRDRWICSAAENAATRLASLPKTPEQAEFVQIILGALDNVRDTPAASAPAAETTVADEEILCIIAELSGKKGAPIADVLARIRTLGLGEPAAKAVLARLMEEGECYTPTTEIIKVA